MSTSSIWSSKSTFTSMDEMLPIVAAGGGGKREDVKLLMCTQEQKCNHSGRLTSLIVSDAKVCRRQVGVHIVLEDLLKETLPLS